MKRGPAQFPVPDLVGLLLSQARQNADDEGFGITTGDRDEVQLDGNTYAVLRQEPAAGALVHYGAWITVEVEPLWPDGFSGVREPRRSQPPHPQLGAHVDDTD